MSHKRTGERFDDKQLRSVDVAGPSGMPVGLFLLIVALVLGNVTCGGGPASTATAEPSQPAPATLTPADINSRYNYAPSSRIVSGQSVYGTSGTVNNPANFLSGQITRLSGKNSLVTIDFGKEVAGIITLNFAGSSDNSQQIGLAFTESSLYIGQQSDGTGTDGALYTTVSGPGTYTMPTDKLRGGFRYLTIFLGTDGWVDLNKLALGFSPVPAMQDARNYAGYFYSNDDLLNRIWYAGAYTVQMDTIDSTQGRAYPLVTSGWENDAVLGAGPSVVTDGAKRDRTLWAGDLAVEVRTAFVSTNDMLSVRNSLDAIYLQQRGTGEFPFAGPPVNSFGSDSYHLWTLIDSAEYVEFSGDKAWLDSHWNQFKLGVQFELAKIDSNGVLNVDLAYDWGRIASASGEVISANVLLYEVLKAGADLAQLEGDTSAQTAYSASAQNLKLAINSRFWDANAGAYANTPGSQLYPQDGNSLAVEFGLTNTVEQNTSICQLLRKNWNSFGSQSPEKPNAIAPFIGAFEVNARFEAGDDQAALDLIRLEWGYMLNSPIGTNSTFWEGYQSDGSLYPASTDLPSWYLGGHLGPFMSLAHGWSTGPTSALTFYVLGLTPSGTSSTYSFIPHTGDLTHVEGTVPLPGGAVTASWTRNSTTGEFSQTVAGSSGLVGTVGVPSFGRPVSIFVDGQLVWNSCVTPSTVAKVGFQSASSDNSYVYLESMSGAHTVTSKAATCADTTQPGRIRR